jgi:hypothetical protein
VVKGEADGPYANLATLTATERVLWPEAKRFQVIMAPGSGHCMNLDFLAKEPFNTLLTS